MAERERKMMQPSIIADIEQREPRSAEIWYGHSILTSTLFPSVKPDDGTDFVVKRNGRISYMLEPGTDAVNLTRNFPYGKYPRLLMSWMSKQIRAAGTDKTEFVDPETRTITIPTIYRLCAELGLSQGGATATKLQEQLHNLLICHISVNVDGGFVGSKRKRVHDRAFLPIVEAIRSVEDDRGAEYSGTSFILTREVWERLASESAPYDTRAALHLLNGRSVLPYDIYVWLNGTMHKLDHPMRISWEWLYERFGDSVGTMKDFRKLFRNAVAKVREVYPHLNIHLPNRVDYIILFPSPTAVNAKNVMELEDGTEEADGFDF